LGTAAAAQPPRTLTRRDRPEITSVKITGLDQLDAGALADGLVTHASHCKSLLLDPFCVFSKTPLFYEHNYLDRTELKRDVLRALIFLYRHGYHDAIVDTVLTPPAGVKVAVTFRVIEGPPTILASFAIDTPPHLLPKKALGSDVVPLHVGQPFDLFQLDSAINNIQGALWQRGYADAHVDTSTVVTPGDSGKLQVALHMKVVQGKINTVGTIKITGNHKVAESVIRQSLGFHEGQIYERGQNSANQRTLYQSGMFRKAEITRDSEPPVIDSVRKLHVDVTEAPLHDLQTQFGFNTVEFVQVSGRLTTYNFLGGGRQLIVSGGLSNLFAPALNGQFFFTDVIRNSGAGNFGLSTRPYLQPTWQVGLDLLQPWFLTTANSLGAGVFAHRRSAPGVYVDYGYGGNATFTRHLFDRGDLSLRYQFEETRTDADEVYFCVNFGICDSPTLAAFNHRYQKLSPVALGLNVDQSDNKFYPTGYPTQGFVLKIELQNASSFTESDWRYNRATLDAAWYHAIGLRHAVLAMHARAGWVRPQSTTGKALGESTNAELLNPRVRFYAGGSNSVRGFGENLLGPRVLTIPADSLRFKTIQMSAHNTAVFVFCDPTTYKDVTTCPLNPARIPFPASLGKHGNAVLSDQEFTVRPLGGNQLIEGSVEYRFPLVGALGMATFVDGALVGAGTGNQLEPVHTTGAITPGFGFRYYSSVGAIRIDLGLDPITTEELVVLTQVGVGQNAHLVEVGGRRIYAPAKTEAGFNGFFQRVTLHLSIGQAF
jgi:outer membrane protein insertion porin family/translocation and assembly module TamA